jgi:H+/Cl- antiporter ClcA
LRALWWKAVLLYLAGLAIMALNFADGVGMFEDFHHPVPHITVLWWPTHFVAFIMLAIATGMLGREHKLRQERDAPHNKAPWPC